MSAVNTQSETVVALVPRLTRLHHIALGLIFEMVVPPAPFLDSSLAYASENPVWAQVVRTLKALALVCRSWHVVAIRFLYRDIVLRRVGQIAALVRTLRNRNGGLRELVRGLTFSCFIPETCYEVTNKGLTYLLDRCPNLNSLALLPPFTEWLQIMHEGDIMVFDKQNAFWNGATSITTLTYSNITICGTTVNFLPHHILSCFPNLSSLTLYSYTYYPLIWDERTPSLEFNYLVDIRLHFLNYYYTSLSTRLDLETRNPNFEMTLSLAKQCTEEINALTLLQPEHHLQHVVIQVDYLDSLPERRSMLTGFKGWIDLWVPADCFMRVPSNSGIIYKCMHHLFLDTEFRSLANVRFIDQSLSANFPNLPFLYAPGTINEDDDSFYVHHMFDLCFVESRRMIVQHEQDWSPASIGEVEGEVERNLETLNPEDEEYLESLSPDDAPSVLSDAIDSESEYSWDSGDEKIGQGYSAFHQPPLLADQLTEEEALQIFAAMQD